MDFRGLGRFCARHRRTVLLGWAGLLVLGAVGGSAVFGRLAADVGSSSTESGRGFEILDAHARNGHAVVGLVDQVVVDDPSVRRAVTRVSERIGAMPDVADVRTAYDEGGERLRSHDQQAALVLVTLGLPPDDARTTEVAEAVRDQLHTIEAGRVRVGGEALLQQEFQEGAERDAIRGESVAFPMALLALVLVFGGLVAASMPIVVALVAVAGSLLLLLAASYLVEIAVYAVNPVTMLGFGLAIDYSLLTVYRFREERAAGRSVDEAVLEAAATSGRTVTYSAVTVIAAFSALFVLDDPILRSLAAGGIGVILVAMFATLTLTPALLSRWGHRVRPGGTTDSGFFATLARRVQRRPVVVVVLVGAALIGAGIPFLHAEFRQGGPDALPEGSEVRAVAEALAATFPDEQVLPMLVVAGTAPTDPRLAAYADRIRAHPSVTAVRQEHGLDGAVSALRVYTRGDGQGAEAQNLVRELRAQRPEFRTWVSGQAAYLVDFKQTITTSLPWALLLICLSTLLLLFAMTGSVLVPIKALVMNFLSLGATFGVLVWVFQDGHLADLIGAPPANGLETVVPVLAFVLAFGLSMDYEVFLIARIRELVDRGVPNDEAVARALQRSGRIITSAAALIVIVFIGFATAPSPTVKQMGVALTTAVVVDVTLVRCLLVPATMTLLGDANWWSPRPLRRLHARLHRP